jgi:hypothetical protein
MLLLNFRYEWSDFLYGECERLFEFIHGKDKQNPYTTAFNLLWEKLGSLERLLEVSAFIIFIRGGFKKLFRIERESLTRCLIILWQFSFGDTVDRVLFDTHKFTWNDWLLYAYMTYYSYQTVKIYVSNSRKNRSVLHKS